MRLNDMPMPLGHRIEPGELFDPIRVLKSMHDEQLAFCNRLDALLDDLNPDEGTTNALLLRKFLSEHVPLYMRVEEEASFHCYMSAAFRTTGSMEFWKTRGSSIP